MLRLSAVAGVRVFRNNTGQAWTGKSKRFVSSQNVNVKNGDVLIQEARPFHAGLCVGSSDIIGFRSVIVTPEMIGKPVAVFMAVEVKTGSGRATPEQVAFINMVNNNGGIGVIARSEDEALQILRV